MEYNIKDFLSKVDPKIYQRGKNYYEDQQVMRVSRDGNRYTAFVIGSGAQPYSVKVVLSDGGQVEHYACDCPYDLGDVCKHIVAVMLAIQDGAYEEVSHNAEDSLADTHSSSLAAALQNASREELETFILQIAEDHTAIYADAVSAFGAPVELEMEAIKEQLADSIRQNNRRGYVDYRGCDNVCHDMDNILDKAEKRKQKGQYLAALTIAEFVFFSGMKLASYADSSSGSLSFSMDCALTIIEACVKELALASEAERQAAFLLLFKDAQKKVFDGWDDSRYSLLENAARLADKKTAKKLIAYLDRLFAKLSDKSYHSFEISADKVVRYRLITALDGEAAGRAYIDSNLDENRLRRIAIEQDIASGNSDRAEKLCLEKAMEVSRRPYLHPDDWNYVLYDIYVHSKQIDKQLAQARRLLLLGDTSYFDVLEELFENADLWDSEYPKILAQVKAECPVGQYMSILASQREVELLMEQVRRFPETVFSYGKLLSSKYPTEIYGFCSNLIVTQAQEAKDRHHYKKVCSSIKTLIDFGGKDAAVFLIRKLRNDYSRRPAFQDELTLLDKWM